MRIIILSLFSLLITSNSTIAQTNDYQVNETILNKIPDNVNVVGLGDPTHQESTITKYRIDLIKELVEEKQFSIIAIEGNIYELYHAHRKFIRDGNISHLEKAMYSQLNLVEMEALYHYVYERNKKGDSILIVGFDAVFSGETFTENIKQDLAEIGFLSEHEKNDFIAALKKANITNLKALFRNNKKLCFKIVTYSKLILDKFIPKSESDFFFEQALKNIVFLYGDNAEESDNNRRDLGMANNIKFIRGQFPHEKIILYGSSTHLLKHPKGVFLAFYQNNRKTLGNILADNTSDNYYFIAYSGVSGSRSNLFNKPKELAEPIKNSVEYKAKLNDDFPLFLTKNASFTDEKINCRFLGHFFIETDLWNVMDGLVLIKDIMPAKIKRR
jgi:erythromycin esterase-like protein